MRDIITENTIVTIYEVTMDYVYVWGKEVPIVDALREILMKEREDERTSTFHICTGEMATNRICSIAMNNIRFDEDNCLPDVKTVADFLTRNGIYEFQIKENWNLEKSLEFSGLSKEKIKNMLNN